MTKHALQLSAMLVAGALVAAQVGVAPTSAAEASHPDSPVLAVPAPTGPHPVGRRLALWTDHDRSDPTDGDGPRELLVWIWYPAARSAAAEHAAPEPALPGPWGERRLDALATRFGAGVAKALRELRVHARTDAPMTTGPSRLPVVLFTPGLGWLPTDYSILVEDLASHGYVVVGLAQPGFAEIVRMPDGREVRRTLGMGAAIGTDQAHLFDDALFAIRQIRQLDAVEEGFLGGRIDLDRIGALGHSIGGITAFVAAARDSSVRAAVNIDGDPMGEASAARPRQPMLLISSGSPSIQEAPSQPSPEHMSLVQQGLERSERRRTSDWIEMSQDATRAYRIRIETARHLNFTDAALASGLLVTPEARWMKVGAIAPERGLTSTSALIRGFFALTLLGTGDEALLRAPHELFPEARFEPVPE